MFTGSISDLDEEEAVALSGASRRGRRAQQRKDEGGKLLTFKGKGRPEGAVMIREGMTLREFADKLGVRAKDLMKALFDRGIMANINQVLEPQLAEQLARDLGVEVMVVSFEEEVQLKEELAATSKGSDATEAKNPGISQPSAVPATMQRATQTVRKRSNRDRALGPSTGAGGSMLIRPPGSRRRVGRSHEASFEATSDRIDLALRERPPRRP